MQIFKCALKPSAVLICLVLADDLLKKISSRRGEFEEARAVFQRAMKIRFDYPEYIFEDLLSFEHQHGRIEDFERVDRQVRRHLKGVMKHRAHVGRASLSGRSKLSISEVRRWPALKQEKSASRSKKRPAMPRRIHLRATLEKPLNAQLKMTLKSQLLSGHALRMTARTSPLLRRPPHQPLQDPVRRQSETAKTRPSLSAACLQVQEKKTSRDYSAT